MYCFFMIDDFELIDKKWTIDVGTASFPFYFKITSLIAPTLRSSETLKI